MATIEWVEEICNRGGFAANDRVLLRKLADEIYLTKNLLENWKNIAENAVQDLEKLTDKRIKELLSEVYDKPTESVKEEPVPEAPTPQKYKEHVDKNHTEMKNKKHKKNNAN